MDKLFKQLLDAPDSATLLVTHLPSRQAWLISTVDCVLALTRLIKKLSSELDVSELECQMLSTSSEEEHAAPYYDELIRKGWAVRSKKPVAYKPVMRRVKMRGKYLAIALLRSNGNLYEFCGAFETMPECKQFIQDYLSTPFPSRVLALNSITKGFAIEKVKF